ncbi:MAG: hypothetical protein JJU00_06385 [Opitutales bacterium]|nr:hypothetical protein [Opitutales bacterium]
MVVLFGTYLPMTPGEADEPSRPVRFERPPPPPRMNEIEIGTRYLLSPDISVRGLGEIPFNVVEQTETNLVIGVERRRQYDDGVIRQDYQGREVVGGDGQLESVPTTDEFSANFAFQREGQIRDLGDGETGVAFSRFAASPSDPQFAHEVGSSGAMGWEMRYRRFIDTSTRFAMQVGFGFNGFDSSFDESIQADLRVAEDIFRLIGSLPDFPEEGQAYNGTRIRGDDSLLIHWSPEEGESREFVVEDDATVRSSVDFRSSIVSLRMGPTYDMDLFGRMSLNFGAGIAAGLYSSKFSVFETMEIDSVLFVPQRELVVTADRDFFYAGYVDAGASYRINERVRFFSSVQYQGAGGDHTHRGQDERTVEVDLDTQIYVNAGFGIRF